MKKKRRYVQATGMFAGLRVPEDLRGQYVLINKGKVMATADSPKKLVRVAEKNDVRAVILYVPEEEDVIAAY